jgi:hypothetical protein
MGNSCHLLPKKIDAMEICTRSMRKSEVCKTKCSISMAMSWALRPVSVKGVLWEFSKMTYHLYCIDLWDETPSLNAQGHSTIS